MAVIEMFVGDKDIVVYRLGIRQVLIEEVWIKRYIDVAEASVKCTASPPPEKYVFHLAIGYRLSAISQEMLALIRYPLLTTDCELPFSSFQQSKITLTTQYG